MRIRKDWVPLSIWIANGLMSVIGLSLLSPIYVEKCQRAADGTKENCGPQHIGMYLFDVLVSVLRDYAFWNTMATVAIAAFTFSLMRSTKHMWIATKEASIAAKRSAVIAEQSLSSLQRAFVFPKEIEVNKRPDGFAFRIRWENSGSSPALRVKQHFNWALFDGPMDDRYPLADHGTPANYLTYIAPKGTTRSGPVILSVDDIARVWSGPITLYFWGWITYRDIFDSTPQHITRFCWQAIVTGADPRAIQGELECAFSSHSRGNCVDQDCNQ